MYSSDVKSKAHPAIRGGEFWLRFFDRKGVAELLHGDSSGK